MERDKSIDIAKALGIVFIVVGHIFGLEETPAQFHVRNYLYQFHVPLFFFLSGYCFKETESWRLFLGKKVKRLYVPFLICNLFFFAITLLALWIFGEPANSLFGEPLSPLFILKKCVKIFLGLSTIRICGASWFLMTLLESLILYKLLFTLFGKLYEKMSFPIILALTSLVIAIIGFLVRLPYGLERAFVAVFFICAGNLTKKYGNLIHINDCVLIPIMLMGVFIILLFSRVNFPDMVIHKYGNFAIYLTSAIIGIYCTLIFSSFLSRFHSLRFLANWGSVTMWILLFHFAAFKIVTLLQIILMGLSWDVFFSFPCNKVSFVWGLLYFIFGFFIPLATAKLYGTISQRSIYESKGQH